MKTTRFLTTMVLGALATAALLCFLSQGAPAAHGQGPDGYDTYYVAPGGDCGGMTPCYASVQAAVDAADDPGDVIKVAAGVYTGINSYGGLAQVVYISKTLTLRGGYTIADWNISNPEANPTTLDAQGQGRVIFITGDISPTIEGLRITGGDATILAPWEDGGGVYIIDATAILNNNRIFSNTAEGGSGGGLSLHGSSALLSRNTIMSNTAHGGGGLLLALSSATLRGNTFSDNTAKGGGGVDLVRSNATLSSNVIVSNTASFWGGGLYIDQESNATLVNILVIDNWAGSQGSGLYIRGSSPYLLHTTVARNIGGDGSGIYITTFMTTPSTVAFTNTILVSHTVGITVAQGNTATLQATLWGSGPWANDADWGGAGSITTGTVNVYGDPAFTCTGDACVAPYHIGPSSAARDAGVDAGVATDIDGDPRPIGPAPDLGADEAWRWLYLPLVMRAYP